MSTLLSPWKEKVPIGRDLAELQADCFLVIVAGRLASALDYSRQLPSQASRLTCCMCRSDSTSATLTYLFYELAKHPDEVSKLRDELTTHLAGGSDLSSSKIRDLSHLNGIINETLRLYAVAPTGLPRVTPPEGIEIDDTHIPGNMTITCPQYVMGRSMFQILSLPICSSFETNAGTYRSFLQARKSTPMRKRSFQNAGIRSRR